MVHIDRRIRWQEYHLLSLARAGDELVANDQRLAVFKEDAGAGRCDQHSVEFLRMDTALIATGVDYRDVNGDGADDLVIQGTEIECRSQAESSFESIYLARENGFEQHRILKGSPHRNKN
jgi:hypothetical protein